MGKMGKPLDPTKTEVSGLEVENKQTNKQAKHFTAFGAKKNAKSVRADSERTLSTKFEKQRGNYLTFHSIQ